VVVCLFAMAAMNESNAVLLSYTLAYVLCLVVIVYVLNFPGWLTESYDIVKEFYIKNGMRNFFLDWAIIGLYLLFADFFIRKLELRGNASKLAVVAAVCVVLYGVFYAIFTRTSSLRGSFYHRWFTRVGPRGLAFEIVLVCSVYFVFQKLLCKFKYHKLI